MAKIEEKKKELNEGWMHILASPLLHACLRLLVVGDGY